MQVHFGPKPLYIHTLMALTTDLSTFLRAILDLKTGFLYDNRNVNAAQNVKRTLKKSRLFCPFNGVNGRQEKASALLAHL